MRSFFLFSLLVAAASAFVAPANQAVGKSNFELKNYAGKSNDGPVQLDDVINRCQANRCVVSAGKKDNVYYISERLLSVITMRITLDSSTFESVHKICSAVHKIFSFFASLTFVHFRPDFLHILYSLQPCLHR